jgi:hypothetical protein
MITNTHRSPKHGGNIREVRKYSGALYQANTLQAEHKITEGYMSTEHPKNEPLLKDLSIHPQLSRHSQRTPITPCMTRLLPAVQGDNIAL